MVGDNPKILIVFGALRLVVLSLQPVADELGCLVVNIVIAASFVPGNTASGRRQRAHANHICSANVGETDEICRTSG